MIIEYFVQLLATVAALRVLFSSVVMDEHNYATSGKHQRSSATNAFNNKRQKMTSPSCLATQFQNEGVLAAINKLTRLVEHYPQFHSKLEGMLEEVFNTLEPEVSAAV